MSEDNIEIVAEFDPASWKPDRDTNSGEEIFSEADAIEEAVRILQEQGVMILSIWHSHESAIKYAGEREYISLGLLQNSAAEALMEAMREISCAIDAQDGIECYIVALREKHFLHIRNTSPEAD